jgi:hypothetical protein
MPRYEDKEHGWWVEIQGAADTPMGELNRMYLDKMDAAWPVVQGIVKDSKLTDPDGSEFSIADVDVLRLSFRQWLWLRECATKAMQEEIASGEA